MDKTFKTIYQTLESAEGLLPQHAAVCFKIKQPGFLDKLHEVEKWVEADCEKIEVQKNRVDWKFRAPAPANPRSQPVRFEATFPAGRVSREMCPGQHAEEGNFVIVYYHMEATAGGDPVAGPPA